MDLVGGRASTWAGSPAPGRPSLATSAPGLRFSRTTNSSSGGTPVRIAQVSPLFESVTPKLYGGTERVVSYLTEELVAQGHDVTLFASADSVTTARLVPIC